jgi:large repetitive protein
MFRRHRALLLAATAASALVSVSGASGDDIVGYTATGNPTQVAPSVQTPFTIALTNKSPSRSADRASIRVPAGFVVDGTSVRATASCGAAEWEVDSPVPSADGRIIVERGSGGSTNNLCPGGTLTVAFSATSPATEGTYTWATELRRGEDEFVLDGAQPTVKVETDLPLVTLTAKPPAKSKSSSATFEFTSTEATTFDCKLDSATFDDCTSPKSYDDLSEGSHTFAVRARDGAGNTGPATTYTWTIDTVAPVAAITQKPTNPSNDASPTFSFSASETAQFECKLDAGSFAACSSPRTYTTGDGLHTFRVKAIDAAGNTGEANYTWTIDTVAPTVDITRAPTNPSNVKSPVFEFSASEGSVQCKLDAGSFAACTSPKSYTNLNDGTHTFTVRATDAAGNTGEASYVWAIDTAAPTVTITGKPSDPSNVKSPTFLFSASEGLVQCRLDAASFAACSSPKSYSNLADGSHTFTVRATDAAGNTGQASHGWTIDTVAPTVEITRAPANPSNVMSPVFEFSASEGSVQCKLDAGSFATCTSPKSYSNLGDDTHTFTVRATDQAGNTGEDSYTWLIETDLPLVTLTVKPPAVSKSSSGTFEFTATEPASFQCKLDGATFADCRSPQSYGDLSDGSHAFAVRATDGAGNTGPETLYTWTIDTTGPPTAITEKPADPTNGRSATFGFASEAGAKFECRLDDGPFAACAPPQAYAGLEDGRHTFVVRAADALGNVGPEAVHDWTIETRAPAVAVTAGPPGLGNSTAASFAFSADEPATFQCNLDDRGFEPCSSPAAYVGLREGSHAFVVRATDAAGNVGAASRSWMIDTTAPETRLDSRPPAKTTATTAAFRFSTSEPATFECRLDGGSFAPCTSPKTYRALARGRHSFAVRAVDSAGNVDATPSLWQWTRTAATRRVASSPLFAPPPQAQVTRPPLLRWRAVRRATYYNVQLYRAGRKVLTTWPTRARLQLRPRWRFEGRVQSLRPGLYRWYVWPGYGRASARRYGPPLGTSTFVVRR